MPEHICQPSLCACLLPITCRPYRGIMEALKSWLARVFMPGCVVDTDLANCWLENADAGAVAFLPSE